MSCQVDVNFIGVDFWTIFLQLFLQHPEWWLFVNLAQCSKFLPKDWLAAYEIQALVD